MQYRGEGRVVAACLETRALFVGDRGRSPLDFEPQPHHPVFLSTSIEAGDVILSAHRAQDSNIHSDSFD